MIRKESSTLCVVQLFSFLVWMIRILYFNVCVTHTMELLFWILAFRWSFEQAANQMLLTEHDYMHDAAKGSQCIHMTLHLIYDHVNLHQCIHNTIDLHIHMYSSIHVHLNVCILLKTFLHEKNKVIFWKWLHKLIEAIFKWTEVAFLIFFCWYHFYPFFHVGCMFFFFSFFHVGCMYLGHFSPRACWYIPLIPASLN